jgi:hypothetical protein
MPQCPWNGQNCDCGSFPYRIDGLIPKACEANMGLDMIPVRSVRPPLKALHKQWLSEMKSKTYDPMDPKWSVR